MKLEDIFFGLGVSVVAGFVVVFLQLVGKLLWARFLERYYLQLTCRHIPDIGGTWTATYDISEGKIEATDTTKLVQYGYKIEGWSEYKTKVKSNGAIEVKNFVISGVLRNDIFSGYYYNSDRRKKGSGAFSYTLSNGGGSLIGGGVFYDVNEGKSFTVEYQLDRV